MTIITPEQAQKLLDGATRGPWQADGDPWNRIVWSSAENRVCFMAHTNGLDDARDIATSDLVAAAPDLARSLIATHEALAKMEERAKEAEDRNAEWADRAEAAERLAADRLDHIVAAEAQLAEAQKREATETARADAAEALVKGLRDFVVDFADAKIDALRYSPPHGASPEDEPDPVVDAETVWAWQADAKDAIKAAALAQQPPASGDDGRG